MNGLAQHPQLVQGETHTVDDRPFGGGPGMVMKVEPVVECVEAVRSQSPDAGHLVMLTPQGRRLDQPAVDGWPGTVDSYLVRPLRRV